MSSIKIKKGNAVVGLFPREVWNRAQERAKDPNAKTMKELLGLWELFGNITVDEDDKIDVPFLHFKIGTHREVVWHWFEEQNSEFSVGKIMNGDD